MITRVSRVATVAATAAWALTLAGCALGGGVAPPPTPPPEPPVPPVDVVTVSGSVSDTDGDPSSGTVVVFTGVDTADHATVSADDDGAFVVTLAPGQYVASCVSLDGDCAPQGPEQIDVSASTTQDFVVTPYGPGPDPEPGPGPDPGPGPAPGPDDDLSAQCRSGGFTVCGQVVKDGEPVPGVVVEFTFGNENQSVTTNASGGYGIDLGISVATALCEEPDDLLDQHYICGAIGTDGGPVTVDDSEQGRIVNFRLCPTTEYPECLQEP